MKRPSLPYLQRFKDRHGKMRCYFRKRGMKLTPLPGRPGEDRFLAAYAEAQRRVAAPASAIDLAVFDGLAHGYRRSSSFLGLMDSTKAAYRREIERFCSRYGAKRVAHLQRRHIREMMAERFQTGGPEAANNLLRIARVLCAFAVDNDILNDNPCLGIKRFRMRGEGFPPWSEEEIGAYLSRWEGATTQRLGLLLLLYTGQRRGDVIHMGRQHVRGDTIRVRQSKTGARLVIPMHAELRAVLDRLPAERLTFLTTQYDKPFSNAASFGNSFRRWCDAAGLANRSAHGLRKSAAVRLVEAGCSSKEVAAITGHASLREIERYTKAAEQEKLARAAISRLVEHG